jgi:hydroxyethylthiazole kinase-like uncharacterized protein yjeF
MKTSEIQADRVGCAVDCAARSGCTVVLKGAGTVVARPDGRFFINTTGNAGMATGGTGDVLTGMIGALLAMGFDTLTSALTAVFLHGAAGDKAAVSTTEHALNATDIIDSIGPTLKDFLTE